MTLTTIPTPGAFATVVTARGNIKSTYRLPTRADGTRCRRFRAYTADADVAFGFGTWTDIERVGADLVNDCGCPRLTPGHPVLLDTEGGEYITFKRPNFDVVVSTVVIECLDGGIAPASAFVPVDDSFFGRYVAPLGPVQGYHLSEDADDHIGAENGAWVGTANYGLPTESILGGYGSSEYRANGHYVRVAPGDVLVDLNASATFLVWCRYWDGNGNGAVAGNIGPLDYVDADYSGGFRTGWIGTNWNVLCADQSGALAGSNTVEPGTESLKTVAGSGGLWFLNVIRYDAGTATFTNIVRSSGVEYRKDNDTSISGDLNPTSGYLRFGASQGLSTWEGSMCEGYVFDKALSDSEIEAVFIGGYPGIPAPPPSGFSSGFNGGFGG